MLPIPKADPTDVWLKTAGQWRPCTLIRGDVKQKTAHVSCPDCGRVNSLSNHTIHPTGAVTPSVVCSHVGCRFHEYIVLTDWEEA